MHPAIGAVAAVALLSLLLLLLLLLTWQHCLLPQTKFNKFIMFRIAFFPDQPRQQQQQSNTHLASTLSLSHSLCVCAAKIPFQNPMAINNKFFLQYVRKCITLNKAFCGLIFCFTGYCYCCTPPPFPIHFVHFLFNSDRSLVGSFHSFRSIPFSWSINITGLFLFSSAFSLHTHTHTYKIVVVYLVFVLYLF